MLKVRFYDLNLRDYKEVWDLQEHLFAEMLPENAGEKFAGHLIFVEHPHVLTMGNSGNEKNLLVNQEQLEKIGMKFYRINRGGDITYHGQGQLVGYPIIRLDRFQIGIRTYIEKLEETIIATLQDFGIPSSRLPGATGVWIDIGSHEARKICAIGVRASRQVTMHGFAFNINTDLNYYRYINPCGFIDKGVTSMQQELGTALDTQLVKKKVAQHFSRVFGVDLVLTPTLNDITDPCKG